jgi:3-deoxy-manno-octulosonate cytidylyltransferase (CMP-KDO synthetase)
MSNTLIIIPSRMSARRLPGKPLLKIKGKTIIAHVLSKAKKCKIGKVIVATEDKEIVEEVKKNRGKVILTSKKHKSGTDRIWEAFKKINDRKIKYVINLQGDEPLVDINDIRKLNKIVQKNKFDISTLALKIKDNKICQNKNIVKVSTKKNITLKTSERALNFNRYLKKRKKNLYQHIGIYQYSVAALEKFSKLKRTKNEIKYKLEQLRALDNKISINVILAKKKVVGIDTKEDYIELKKILEYKS